MNRVFRQIILLGIALLAAPLAAIAEPSAAYLKCEAKLADKADQHREKADKALRNSDERVEKLIRKAVKKGGGDGTSADEFRDSAEQIRKWYRLDKIRRSYVEGTINSLTRMDDDGPDFKCRPMGGFVGSYNQFIREYEFSLKLFEEGVEERIELEDLRDDEGLVVIAFNSNLARTRVGINRRGAVGGNIGFDPIGSGEHFRVYRAKAGIYNWDEVTQKRYASRWLFDLSNLDLGFEVKPGKLNYAGVFMFDLRAGNYYSATLEDRLTITLVVLEQHYPELIRQYEIVNGLVPDDRFTEFYLSEKGLIKSGSATDDHE